MTTTPTPEALRHRAAARHWALGGLVAFTAASVVVNVVVIAGSGGDVLRLLIGALAPIVLGQMTHQLTKLMQAELTVSGIPTWVNRGVAAATAAIGAGAFWLSFETLRRAAEPDHGGSAWVFPATLDLAIVVCSVSLAVIARADEADQRAGAAVHGTVQEQVVQDASLPEPRTTGHSAELVDQVADLPVDPIPAAMVQPDPQPVHETVDQAVNHPVTWDDADTEPLAVQAADQPQERVDQHPEPEVDREPEPVLEPLNHRTLSLVDQPTDRDVDHRSIAEQVVARTASDWTVDQLELVSRSTPGPGRRVLADELGVSASTVSRMRKAIEQVTAETETATTAGASA